MKDFLRDYATEAFRFYAKCGKPTYEELENKIRDEAFQVGKNEAIKSGLNNPVEAAYLKAEKTLEERAAELLDILAVEDTLKFLRQEHIQAIELVYFIDPDKLLQKGDISCRVTKAEQVIPASQRQIYYWLRQARMMFAEFRGLESNRKVCSSTT